MLRSTLPILQCPVVTKKIRCQGEFSLDTEETGPEIDYGELCCKKCKEKFPILAGVAVLVNDVRLYLLTHVKGISKFVPDSKIPLEYLEEYVECKSEIEEEHIEEDLESDRVNALYLMNHYLTADQMKSKTADPIFQDLIFKYWDQGPFRTVDKWVTAGTSLVELGCGVGGLYRCVSEKVKSYLGVDSSFQSVLIARHLNLGTKIKGELKTPKDLLYGNLFESFPNPCQKNDRSGKVDFIVGDIDAVPLKQGAFDVSISLNAIDMLEEPKILPITQKMLVKSGGTVIQSGPYIWHERISRHLRAMLPKNVKDSASAVEWLYESEGLKKIETEDHVPWLFFKHSRQLELYSVHLLKCQKT